MLPGKTFNHYQRKESETMNETFPNVTTVCIVLFGTTRWTGGELQLASANTIIILL